MHAADPLLLTALSTAPRRYRLPPLPDYVHAARGAGPETALAFAIATAHAGGREADSPPVQSLFAWALADMVRAAMASHGGDPAFQALVLRSDDALVAEHVQLASQQHADEHSVRSVIDAVAHPGKLRRQGPSALAAALAPLHLLAQARAWVDLREAITQLLAHQPALPPEIATALGALPAHPALQRLERASALLGKPSVQRYQALCAQRGPLAGSVAAAAQGRAAGRAGAAAESTTWQAFTQVAQVLDRHGASVHRAVRGLRAPRGFPGHTGQAKDEWDVAIVHDGAIVLLAEVKAAPAAAVSDFARLLRGLQRLAHADADVTYEFASPNGVVPLRGSALRQLQPHAGALPAMVIYCCTAPSESRPPLLNAATKGVLLTEPAILAFARRLARGEAVQDDELLPVWHALTTVPRLLPVLHQDQTARAAREAMLHPQDLLETVAALAA